MAVHVFRLGVIFVEANFCHLPHPSSVFWRAQSCRIFRHVASDMYKKSKILCISGGTQMRLWMDARPILYTNARGTLFRDFCEKSRVVWEGFREWGVRFQGVGCERCKGTLSGNAMQKFLASLLMRPCVCLCPPTSKRSSLTTPQPDAIVMGFKLMVWNDRIRINTD